MNDLITKDEYEQQGGLVLEEEQARLDAYYEVMGGLVDELPPRGIPRIAGLSRKRVMEAFQDSFELIGGVPRLAAWAHEHPGEFYRLFSKLMPSQASSLVQNNTMVIKHVIPPSALDE